MSKADLHVHSKYSEHPSEWILQRLGTKESYTEPEQIYKTMKQRGMKFITITDHNCIDGAIKLNELYPGEIFIGVESTAYFPEDKCKVHILIYNILPSQFEVVQGLRSNIYLLRDYLRKEELAHSVAHATYSVNGVLRLEHLEKLILLFDVFEGINGGRHAQHNLIWMHILQNLEPKHIEKLYCKHKIEPFSNESWIKGFTAGSDDHAGLFGGTSYTQATARNIFDFTECIRQKRTQVSGRSNDFLSFIYTIFKIGWDFSLSKGNHFSKMLPWKNNQQAISSQTMATWNSWKKKLLLGKKTTHDDFRNSFYELLSLLQEQKGEFSDERLRAILGQFSNLADDFFSVLFTSLEKEIKDANFIKFVRNAFASLPGIFLLTPFLSSIMHLYKNRDLLNELQNSFDIHYPNRDNRILWFTDTIDDLNGVAVTLSKVIENSEQKKLPITVVSSSDIRENSDHYVNLPSIHEFNLPYYESYKVQIPSILRSLEIIYDQKPQKIIISTPGPIGMLGLLVAKTFHVPCVGIYHTDYTLQSQSIHDDNLTGHIIEDVSNIFYNLMDEIQVPTHQYVNLLETRGFDKRKMKVFSRGLETDTFYPKEDARINIEEKHQLKGGRYFLYTGRISKEKNLYIVIEAFLMLSKKYDNLYFFLIGDGPEKAEYCKLYPEENIFFLGKMERNDLVNYYAGCDLFLFPSTSDTFGMSVLEAQACGLPCMVSDRGGPCEIIEPWKTGFIVDESSINAWEEQMNEFLQFQTLDHQGYRNMRSKASSNAHNKASWDKFLSSFL